jgi:hypothetical protein
MTVVVARTPTTAPAAAAMTAVARTPRRPGWVRLVDVVMLFLRYGGKWPNRVVAAGGTGGVGERYQSGIGAFDGR